MDRNGVTHREDAAETALHVAYGLVCDRFYCHGFVGRVVIRGCGLDDRGIQTMRANECAAASRLRVVVKALTTQHEVDGWETAILAREQREESQRASLEERVAAVAGE